MRLLCSTSCAAQVQARVVCSQQNSQWTTANSPGGGYAHTWSMSCQKEMMPSLFINEWNSNRCNLKFEFDSLPENLQTARGVDEAVASVDSFRRRNEGLHQDCSSR